MANRRARRRPTARPTSLLLILIALLLAFRVAAAPASAHEDWEHGGAKQSTRDSSGCHKDKPASNTAYVGRHSGHTTSGSQMCWDCHEPGSATSVSCGRDCHLFQASGDHGAYPTAFSHGVTPHLGASGYGKTCADCHDAGNPHHDASAGPAPACATCHNGTYAAVPAGHEGRGTVCTACHVGMNRPVSDCASCHVGNASSGGPQIVYSNSPACGDAGCHNAATFGAVACTTCHSKTGAIGQETLHATDPAATVSCTTCHEAHYETLGACDTCHGSHAQTHHGTATLADTQLKLAAGPSKIRAHRKAMLTGTRQAGDTALAFQSVLVQARKLKGGPFK
ncbi:MAG: hypothetical protein NTW58_02605 [Actinobacteria bacterium]|nr:hypothetical protein [Actinomycetota bacterium]